MPRPGRELALTLVGLPLDEAKQRCLERGYIAKVGTTILNLRYDRVRLVVEEGVVTRADAG